MNKFFSIKKSGKIPGFFISIISNNSDFFPQEIPVADLADISEAYNFLKKE